MINNLDEIQSTASSNVISSENDLDSFLNSTDREVQSNREGNMSTAHSSSHILGSKGVATSDHEGELENDTHTSTTRSRGSVDSEDFIITGAYSVSSHSVSSSYQDSAVVKNDSKNNSSVPGNYGECEMNTNFQNGETTSRPSISDRDVPGRTVERNDIVDRELFFGTHQSEVIEE